MSEWQPIETASKDEASPILAYFDHAADPYNDPADPMLLTDYASNTEAGGFLAGIGITLAVWRDGYQESEGWEPGSSYWVTGGWFAWLNGDATDYAVNATHWMPLPKLPGQS